jgi:protein-S-isoprenylcysteine O-methyltransferase Ste14
MSEDLQTVLVLIAVWLAYALAHSWLASLRLKRFVADRWPEFMPVYRLVFNGLAVFLLLPPIWLSLTLPGPQLWRFDGPAWWLANGLALLALLGVFWSLRDYDGSEFLGLRQWRDREIAVEDQEGFHISPMHRFVRHPWYCLSLVLIWTRDMDLAVLVSGIMLTLYLVVGSRLEEQKLLVYHGEKYRTYRKLVPGLIPFPGRYLSRAQAAELQGECASSQ